MEIFIVGSICLLLYGLTKLNKEAKERKMMIQMGLNPDNQINENGHNSTLGFLKWGIILAGIGLGLFVAEIFSQFVDMNQDTAYVAMVFIFGGISFIISHLIVSKQIKKQSTKEKKVLEKE